MFCLQSLHFVVSVECAEGVLVVFYFLHSQKGLPHHSLPLIHHIPPLSRCNLLLNHHSLPLAHHILPLSCYNLLLNHHSVPLSHHSLHLINMS